MDFLKAEIASKRKAVSPAADEDASASPEPQNKYMRRGDLEKLEQQQRHKPKATVSSSSNAKGSTSSLRVAPVASRLSPITTAALVAETEKFNVSNQEAVRRLRAKGEPIRLFGESDKERRLRLRALELIEEKGGGSLGQNDFRNALQSAESKTALELLEKRDAVSKGLTDADSKQAKNSGTKDDDDEEAVTDTAGGSAKKEREGVGMDSLLDLNLIKTDIDRVYPIIYYTLKGLLQEWADSLAARPDDVKHTMQGRMAAATQVQSGDYLKPLFKKLRKRALSPDVLMRIAEIVHYVQKREYRHANDSYLQLSIGNAPWPIGVTMVGIHERSGREKIFSSNVAHVLNDEVSRKYIQSLKRLMTFAQTLYPPKDISMMMG